MVWLLFAVVVMLIIYAAMVSVAMVIYVTFLLFAVTLAGVVGFFAVFAISDNAPIAIVVAGAAAFCTLLWIVMKTGMWKPKK